MIFVFFCRFWCNFFVRWNAPRRIFVLEGISFFVSRAPFPFVWRWRPTSNGPYCCCFVEISCVRETFFFVRVLWSRLCVKVADEGVSSRRIFGLFFCCVCHARRASGLEWVWCVLGVKICCRCGCFLLCSWFDPSMVILSHSDDKVMSKDTAPHQILAPPALLSQPGERAYKLLSIIRSPLWSTWTFGSTAAVETSQFVPKPRRSLAPKRIEGRNCRHPSRAKR